MEVTILHYFVLKEVKSEEILRSGCLPDSIFSQFTLQFVAMIPIVGINN